MQTVCNWIVRTRINPRRGLESAAKTASDKSCPTLIPTNKDGAKVRYEKENEKSVALVVGVCFSTRDMNAIAESSTALVESLFSPGGTMAGYVVRRNRRSVVVRMGPAEYTINTHLVWCVRDSVTKRYSFASVPGYTLLQLDDMARALVVRSEWVGGEIVRYFKS